MRTNVVLFWVLAVFFFLADVLYIVWGLLDPLHSRIEWVGAVGIALTGVLSAFIAFYLGRARAAQGGELPEDRNDANIDDGDPELGFFSPWSWWPIVLGAALASVFLGVAIGPWIAYIGVSITVVALVGWTFEYYRGRFGH